MEEIRTNLSKEDVVHNMLEIAFYLAQQGKDVNEIDVKVKDLNMHFEAWMDDAEQERVRDDRSKFMPIFVAMWVVY